MKRLIVALRVPRRIGPAIVYARHIATQMKGNPFFPSPPVAIAALEALIADADAAQAEALRRTVGASAALQAKLELVRIALEQLRVYVQTVARQASENAAQIVVSSGMSVKQSAGYVHPMFSVRQWKASDAVRLAVRRQKRGDSYEFQKSTDGKTWTDLGRTKHAFLVVENLSPGTRYFFRYRTLTAEGFTDWSDALTIMVG